jgi:hypothetical protein
MALAILRALSDRIFSLFQRNETQFGRKLQFRRNSSSSLAQCIAYSADIVDSNYSFVLLCISSRAEQIDLLFFTSHNALETDSLHRPVVKSTVASITVKADTRYISRKLSLHALLISLSNTGRDLPLLLLEMRPSDNT